MAVRAVALSFKIMAIPFHSFSFICIRERRQGQGPRIVIVAIVAIFPLTKFALVVIFY